MDIPIQIILCTCPSRQVAEQLARSLIVEKLAACVNIVPNLLSVYLWQGEIESTEECLLLIKAPGNHYPKIEQALRAQHPYELPEIIALTVQQGLPEYLQWIQACIKN